MTSNGGHERWSCAGFRGLVRAGWGPVFDGHDPVAWVEAASVTLMRDRASVRVHRCESARGVLYGKVITGASDAGPGEAALWARVKWAARWSRSVAAMRTSRRMELAGVACAPVVLAARRRSGLGATDVLVMQGVPGLGLMSTLRGQPPMDEQVALCRDAGRAIARMHDEGFMHGDLHPDSMLTTGPGSEMWFIDNDRTREWHMPLPRVLRERNLTPMGYRLAREFDGLMPVFLEEYLASARLGAGARERVRRGVLARVERRLAWLAEHRRQRSASGEVGTG